jgi:membrane fusion protein, multidrug efflux system
MDDRTATDFLITQPLHRPAAPKLAVPRKRRRLAPLIVLAVAALAGWWLYTKQTAPPPPRQNARLVTPVVAVPAVKGDIDIILSQLGTVTPLATVTIKSQISGQLVRVAYQEGQMVTKGDPLVDIDSRPYELALAQAQGALERDQALLQTAELDLKRYQDLAKTNAIPRQQLDTQVSLVAQDRGLVISDRAMIDTQKLNIAYCHIVAPVTGRVGLRLVDQGNYVMPGDATGLAVITQLQPISVIFTVPEDNLPQIVKRLRAGAMLQATAFDRSGTVKLGVGELQTLDNQIDTTTGQLKLRAQFANADENLFPNQFVNIQLLVDVLHDATVVPTSAIQRGAPGTFVYLVDAENTVSVRPITLGPASGERVAVQSGLTPGERVVIDGADKLRNGATVMVRSNEGVPPGGANAVAASPAAGGGAPAQPARANATPGDATPGDSNSGNVNPGSAVPGNAAPSRGTPVGSAAPSPSDPPARGSRRSRGAP